MTTTLESMEETIAEVKAAKPDCSIMIGGAVITSEYAKDAGADHYCKDAMQAVSAARAVFRE
jgi:5-methyltetrahydrofolate--homocysteine methyltransferase